LSALGEATSLPSGAFQFDQLPLHIANNKAHIHMIMRGKLATGEGIEVHETTLPPGGAPTATTYHHPHCEMWLVRESSIELTVNGKTYPLDRVHWVSRGQTMNTASNPRRGTNDAD
jgi:hypothetical protein